MKTCLCFSCKLSRRMKRTMTNGSHRQKNDLIKELANLWLMESEELNYEQAIADGSWPGSILIMERRLAHAKIKGAS